VSAPHHQHTAGDICEGGRAFRPAAKWVGVSGRAPTGQVTAQ